MTFDPNFIDQKLDYLKLRDSKRRIFGSGRHEFELGQKCTESEIAEFEKKHGFQLPHEFRIFLTTVGGSGAGPYYGIYSLGQIGEQIEKWNEDLEQPFPYEGYFNGREGLVDEIEDAEDDEVATLLDEYVAAMCPGGSIIICDFGNDLNFRMLTSGNPKYPAGSIWFNKMADKGGLAPIALETGGEPSSDMNWCVTYRRDVSESVSFSSWYHCWLEQAVRFAETI